MAQRGHAASIAILSLESLAKKAPDVSFIHDFPGPLKSGIARGTYGALFFVKAVSAIMGPFFRTPLVDCGDFHVFLATSARYPASMSEDAASVVPLAGGVTIARGTDGKSGSGIYSINQYRKSAEPKVEELLAQFRREKMAEKVWGHIEDEFDRITGLQHG